MEFSFRLHATDGAARCGELTTPHGTVRTPAFMPVGTQATVKGLEPETVRATGADILLGNTYHLMLRPGAERIAALGGLHQFMRWPHAILTDSGGFQVMSLAGSAQDRGALRHLPLASRRRDCRIVAGARRRDPGPARRRHRHAARRMRQAAGAARRSSSAPCNCRCDGRSARAAPSRRSAKEGRALFGIVQGGDDPALRVASARELIDIGFEGYAIGGLAVGESPEVMRRDDRRDRAGAARRPAALPDGRRDAGGYPRGGRARHRHVRLRDADPQRPPRRRLHALRADHSQERAPCRRSAAAGRGESVPGRARLFAGLSASSGQERRDAGRRAPVRDQSRLLPATDRRDARRDRRRASSASSAPKPPRPGRGAICRRVDERSKKPSTRRHAGKAQ